MAQLQLRLNSCPHNHNETEARVKRKSFKGISKLFFETLVSAKAPLKHVCCCSQNTAGIYGIRCLGKTAVYDAVSRRWCIDTVRLFVRLSVRVVDDVQQWQRCGYVTLMRLSFTLTSEGHEQKVYFMCSK